MKKLRITSLLLAILMVVSMIPMMAFTALAADEEDDSFPAMPERLPGAGVRKWDWFAPEDGTIPEGTGLPFAQYNATFTTQTLIDYTEFEADEVTSDKPDLEAYCGPEGMQGKKTATVSLTDGLPEEFAYVWRGASGLMVKVDTSNEMSQELGLDVVSSGAGWHMEIYAEVTRASLNGGQPVVENVVFTTSVNYRDGWQSYYYVYVPEDVEFQCVSTYNYGMSSFTGGTWNCEIVPSNNARIIDNFQGYIYLPFDCSFFCTGANGEGTYEGPGEYDRGGKKVLGDIMTFNQAAEVYDDIKFTNIAVYNDWSDNGAFFKSIDCVFADPVYSLSETTQTTPVDGSVTVTGNTPATLTADFSMAGMDGLRMHVDASAVNAPVQLRLSMISNIKKNESKWADGVILGGFVEVEEGELEDDQLATGVDGDGNVTYPYYGDDEFQEPVYGYNSFVKLESDDYIQTISRGYDSLIFYYDENGDPQPLTATDVTDVFAALPAGYNGDIYIPATSLNAWITETLQIPLASAELYDFTAIEFSYESEGSGNVVISNVELCKTDAYITGVTVNMTNEMNLAVYAFAGAGYGNYTMDFYQGEELVARSVLGEAVDGQDNTYKFILPAIALDDLTVEYSATLLLNGNPTDVTVNDYSVLDYAAGVLADEDATDAEKTVVVDLLYYSEAVMKLNGVEDGDVLPTSILTDEQKALHTADTTAADAGVWTLEGEADPDFCWYTPTADFSTGVLAIDMRGFVYDEVGVTAVFTNGDRTSVVESGAWGVKDGLWLIRDLDIGYNELFNEITASYVDFTDAPVGQTITFTPASVIADMANSASTSAEVRECARALYALATSIAALNA